MDFVITVMKNGKWGIGVRELSCFYLKGVIWRLNKNLGCNWWSWKMMGLMLGHQEAV